MVDIWKIAAGITIGAWLALLTVVLAFGAKPVEGAAALAERWVWSAVAEPAPSKD